MVDEDFSCPHIQGSLDLEKSGQRQCKQAKDKLMGTQRADIYGYHLFEPIVTLS